MPKGQRLIVGLGNPGSEYADTRHNIGFMVADAIADRVKAEAFRHDKGNSATVWARWRSRPFGLAKPQTFMNRSGTTVRGLMRHYGVALNDVLVIYDDINLPVGKLRLRPRGSAGGHNGIQDIIDTMGTDDFPRLRIGVGGNFGRGQQVHYVLSPFEPDEEPVIQKAIVHACDAALTFVVDGVTVAMNRYNGKG